MKKINKNKKYEKRKKTLAVIFGFLLSFSISTLAFAQSATVSGDDLVISGGTNSRWCIYQNSAPSASFTHGYNYGTNPFSTNTSVYSAPDGSYEFLQANDLSFDCSDENKTLAESQTSYHLTYYRTGGVLSLTGPPVPPPAMTVGVPGSNFTDGSTGTGTGVMGVFATAVHDYGTELAIILASIIGIGLAYLVFRFGWRKVKGSTK